MHLRNQTKGAVFKAEALLHAEEEQYIIIACRRGAVHHLHKHIADCIESLKKSSFHRCTFFNTFKRTGIIETHFLMYHIIIIHTGTVPMLSNFTHCIDLKIAATAFLRLASLASLPRAYMPALPLNDPGSLSCFEGSLPV